MQRNTKIAISICIVIAVGLTLFETSRINTVNDSIKTRLSDALSKQPTVNITGIIQYNKYDIDYAFTYAIIPDEKIIATSDRKIYLFGDGLIPSLNDTRATVSGKLIEDYGIFLADTLGKKAHNIPVIFVDDIKILETHP